MTAMVADADDDALMRRLDRLLAAAQRIDRGDRRMILALQAISVRCVPLCSSAVTRWRRNSTSPARAAKRRRHIHG
jgi:hypothetical protein